MIRSKTAARPKIIGVSGGSGSGKTTFARLLHAGIGAQLGEGTCTILSQDHYYIDQSAHFQGDGENVNFDHPSALDFPLLAVHLKALQLGKDVEIPIYDFVTHKRRRETHPLSACPFILLDGTLILTQPEVRASIHVSVFIDTPEDVRLDRRMQRDMIERGRTREGVLKQFSRQVKPMHDQFVETSKCFADHVISGVNPFEPAMPLWLRELAGHGS